MIAIRDEHLKVVCKLHGGAECCRYLMMGVDFECAKHPENLAFRKRIDMQKDSMAAKGDNCEGVLTVGG